MEIWILSVLPILLLLLTTPAKPEIPSKGKHTRVLDTQQQSTSNEDADMPRFAEPIANVTVSIGRDALLACVVENLKGYKVAWVRVDTQTILSIHHNLISQNNRISLTYNDHRSWYLHIKEVEENDRGWYMCQVNTDPMRSRKGYLQVVVPPMIVEGMTSNDLVVREGLNVTLVCKARGYPEPYVMWRREDGEEMLIGGEHVNVVDGELLYITKVSRLHMAAYLCVASNGVPPSISKRVHLRVQFPPMLSIPNQLEGAYLGQDVVLECHTEAYPASINYWTTERGDMIISDTSRAGDKYETTSTVSGYTKFMKLKIRSVGPNDFGTYRCVAKNSLGETDGNIKLDEMPTPTTAIISEMAMWNRSLDGKRRNRNKFDLNALPDYGVEEWRDGAGNSGLNGGNHIHGDGNEGNSQTPVRNPPGAFHNSAGGGLAQHNLLGRIIHGIKMQSFGIFQRLSSYFPTMNTDKAYANVVGGEHDDGSGGGGGGGDGDGSGVVVDIMDIVDAVMDHNDNRRQWKKGVSPLLSTQLSNQMLNSLLATGGYGKLLTLTALAHLNNNSSSSNTGDTTNNFIYPMKILMCHAAVDEYHMYDDVVDQQTNKKYKRCNTKNVTPHQRQQQQTSLDNKNVNMRDISSNAKVEGSRLAHWLKAPLLDAIGSRIPTTLAAPICMIIFSIFVMLLLLHLIIDSNGSNSQGQQRWNSNCRLANSNTSHNDTFKTLTTTTSIPTIIITPHSISENRLLPLSSPTTPNTPPSTIPSSLTLILSLPPSLVSCSKITFSFTLPQQQQQQQQISKFKTTTTTTIATKLYSIPVVHSIFHLMLTSR